MQKTNILKKGVMLFTGLSLFFIMALVSCNNEASSTTETTTTDTVATPPVTPTPPPDTTVKTPDSTGKILEKDTSKTNQNPPPPRN